MSADLLREAAALMRERAEAATEGPWKMWNGWGPTSDALYGVERFGPDNGTRIFHHDKSRDLFASAADWEQIATFAHPAVALAVADLLEAEAADLDSRQRSVDGLLSGIGAEGTVQIDAEHLAPAALTLARTYLGRDS